MDRLPLIISGFAMAADRFGGLTANIIRDRLELLSLELLEAKIHFIQALFLTCIGVVLFLLGLLLLILAGAYVLPVEWRLYGLAGAAITSLLAGTAALITLHRDLRRKPLAFDQSLAELKKDAACFSTTN